MNDYEIVVKAREQDRLNALDYIKLVSKDFLELHGDRLYGDDKAIVAGIGTILDMPVTIIGVQKGKTLEERIEHNFGSAQPEGYRKALRLMKQAEKFKRPVLCLVDTAGAYPGIEAEEHGQGRAIADNLAQMSDLRTPIISIVIGEGGSGGALALSHADRIWMMSEAYFSVVSPESCANILWKDTKRADEAANALSLTAEKLYKLGLVDRVIDEEPSKRLATEINSEFKKLCMVPVDELVEARYRKYRIIGY